MIRVLDLFCGAGGSSCGARIAGATIVAGIDMWETAIDTFQLNFPRAKTYRRKLQYLTPARSPAKSAPSTCCWLRRNARTIALQFEQNYGWQTVDSRQALVAFNVYCQLPFGKLHARNPEIQRIASLLGRSPSSLAMKCCNLASLDPANVTAVLRFKSCGN